MNIEAFNTDTLRKLVRNLQDENKPIPEPTTIEDIDVMKGTFAEYGKGIVSLVDVDLTAYRMRLH